MSNIRYLTVINGKQYLVDKESGEVLAEGGLDGVPIWVPKRQIRAEEFVIVSQQAFRHLSKKGLSGQSWQVLFYLCGWMDFENWLEVPQSEIAKALEISRPQVCNAVKKLIEAELLSWEVIPGKRSKLRLAVELFWRGKLKEQVKAVRDVQNRSAEASTEALEKTRKPGEPPFCRGYFCELDKRCPKCERVRRCDNACETSEQKQVAGGDWVDIYTL